MTPLWTLCKSEMHNEDDAIVHKYVLVAGGCRVCLYGLRRRFMFLIRSSLFLRWRGPVSCQICQPQVPPFVTIHQASATHTQTHTDIHRP